MDYQFVKVIFAFMQNECFLKWKELVQIRDATRAIDDMEIRVASSPEQLKALVANSKPGSILLFSNFPPIDSHYEKSTSFFIDLLSVQAFNAIHFITTVSEEEMRAEELRQLAGESEITISSRMPWNGNRIEARKALADSILHKIWQARTRNYWADIFKKEKFLDDNIFYGLNDLNTGFDVQGIRYFSENDFEVVLNRVMELGIGIYGIEPWRDGCFFDVDVYDDYNTEYTDPAWYKESFRKFRELGEVLQYAASIIVPQELVLKEREK